MKKLAILFVCLLAGASIGLVGSTEALFPETNEDSDTAQEVDPSTDPATWEDSVTLEPTTATDPAEESSPLDPDEELTEEATETEESATTGGEIDQDETTAVVPEGDTTQDSDGQPSEDDTSDDTAGETTGEPESTDETESVTEEETTEEEPTLPETMLPGAETLPPLPEETEAPTETSSPAETSPDESYEPDGTTAPAETETEPVTECPHTPGDWVVVTPATCEGEGSRIQTCTLCGDLLNEESIPPTGHTEKVIPGYAATEEYPGLTDGKVCTVCQTVLAEQQPIPSLNGGTSTEAPSAPDEPPVQSPSTDEALVWDGGVATEFDGGRGTPADPYLIANGGQLAYLAALVNNSPDSPYAHACYRLTASIDLDGREWCPIGGGEGNEQVAFYGHFDGNGHHVTHFRITEGGEHLGLFGFVDGGTVANLGVMDVEILAEADNVVYAGGIAGAVTGTLEDCYAKGRIRVAGVASICVGGLVGLQKGGAVRRCFTACHTEAVASADMAIACAGGLVGTLTSFGEITDCYALGAVGALASDYRYCLGYAGGMCGELTSGTVRNSFALGNVTASGSLRTYAGSLFGKNSATAENCFGYADQDILAEGEHTAICAAEKVCLIADLHRKDFYTDTLTWDGDAWIILPGYFPVQAP